MINFWIGTPLAIRMIALGVVGLLAGALANYIIYTWCYFPRAISPWAPPHEKAPTRKALDRIPVLGWLGLSREASIHERGFWVRPMLIEIGLAIGLPVLYWHVALCGAQLPNGVAPAVVAAFEPWGTQIFFSQAILVVLMVAATFIDFDEQTVPDIITVPGTILALVLASFSIFWFMPVVVKAPGGPVGMPATFEMPWWPAAPGWTGKNGQLIALAIWSGWCFALADRRVILRKGWPKAIEFFFAGLVRVWTWKILIAIWIIGIFAISYVHSIGGASWHGLFSALVGLAVGGTVIWGMRIAGYYGLRMEAMGFGDVTLMAMIGAFVGWQGALAAIAISPFTAIVIVLLKYFITGDKMTPFGPYLCAGTLLTMLFWDRVYLVLVNYVSLLGPRGTVYLFLFLFLVMSMMLFAMRMFRERLFYGHNEEQ